MASQPPEERAVHWVNFPPPVGTHPAVVIKVDAGFVTVVHGQGSSDGTGQTIEGGSQKAKNFGLTKTTHFRVNNVCIVPMSYVGSRLGFCSRAEFPNFKKISMDFFEKMKKSPTTPAPES